MNGSAASSNSASKRNTAVKKHNWSKFLAAMCIVFAAGAASAVSTGVKVNGAPLDNAYPSSGPGWSFHSPTLTLFGAGPFTLTGTNTAGWVRVVVPAGVTNAVTFSNLSLLATNVSQCVFALGTNACVSLSLAGTSTLASGSGHAGLEIAEGGTLSITNALGDEAGALTVTGGDYGAGIGGGDYADGGTVTLNGGQVTAIGGLGAAGIGGGYYGYGGTIEITGGTVTATGGMEGGAGIGGGFYGDGGTIKISGGTVFAINDDYGAGIGGGDCGDGGTVKISGGTVTATGGMEGGAGIGGGGYGDGGTTEITGGTVAATGGLEGGAGIGGGKQGYGGMVKITGGVVTAESDIYGAGIGGGYYGYGGTVEISGGMVTATGGMDGGAGIGGGYARAGGTVAISGGTVFAQGDGGGADIGPGFGGTGAVSNIFTGGSIRLAASLVTPAPSNGTERVWCVGVPYLSPGAAIIITALDPYGVNDLFADENGRLYLWLPNGEYTFSAGGEDYEATVADADTAALFPGYTPYITFSSTNTFTITPQKVSWNGALYASTDTTNWVNFTTLGVEAADNGSGEYRLYLCGVSNTHITGAADSLAWTITAEGKVACSGNIETLLDHEIVTNGEHPAMDAYCFANLFKGCTALINAPTLWATKLFDSCYYNMFNSCTGLTEAPALTAIMLATNCYNGMFCGCTGLAQAPELPATTLATACYGYMFYNCTGLTEAPALPATTLADRCYDYMFRGCTGLTQAPELPATNLSNYCYYNLFNRCTGLTEPPALPATMLAEKCYDGMFSFCTGLTNVPALPATTLAPYCYSYMFQGCTELRRLPVLPATNLANSCYQYMFNNCTGIDLNTAPPGTPWSIPADAVEATNWNTNMFAGTGGSFKGSPKTGTPYYYVMPLPPGFRPSIAFSSADPFNITPQANSWNGRLYCSTDTTNWVEFTAAGAEAADNGSGEHKLYLCGLGNTHITGAPDTPPWKITADGAVACSGNIELLLDHEMAANGEHPTMNPYCFALLFKDCAALISTPSLPATNLADFCYNGMFQNCTGLTNAPSLPATTLAGSCYGSMFSGCTGLTSTPTLPATTLANACYIFMFHGCASLTQAPELPVLTLADKCYQYMFQGCTGLTRPPALPATTLADCCYQHMFSDCTGLTNAPALPATTLAESCYRGMFSSCTNLTQAPVLPATTLAPYCYAYMFSSCTSLTQAPALSATTLATSCYGYMFYNCTGLTSAPKLSAMNLAASCYERMFHGCTGLTQTPTLPATTLAEACYGYMFYNCTGLTNAPTLSAMNLAASCYERMFHGCTGLTRLPDLPATTLANYCYRGMFENCTVIRLYTEGYGTPWSIPTNAISATGWNASMFAGTSGSFTGDPAIGTTYYYVTPPPRGSDAYITFSSADAFKVKPRDTARWRGRFYTSTDTTNWVAFTIAGADAADNGSGKYKLYICGTGNTYITGAYDAPGWEIIADGTVACSGNIETLLDYAKVINGEHPAMAEWCFGNLFDDCTALISAPALPAVTLTNHCYRHMFSGCTGLIQAPALPATTLAPSCYDHMFVNCTGLIQAPALPAMTLANWCYGNMFRGCKGLTRLPVLPATNLTYRCYYFMFTDCTGIKLNTEGPGTPWSIPANAISATDWNTSMFFGTGGTFKDPPVIGTTYYYVTPLPPGYKPCIIFSSADTFKVTPQTDSWDGGLYCSIDATNWSFFTTNGATAVSNGSGEYKLYLCGVSNSYMTGTGATPGWTIHAARGTVACSGNIEALLDYAKVTNGLHPVMADYCFANLFENCTALNSAPSLSATTLANSCYYFMFAGCTGLTNAPSLPSMTLTDSCYDHMFRGCTALTQAPSLPAKTLANSCYGFMFSGCTGLTSLPSLPATTLAPFCYNNMFKGCTELTRLPVLPATNLANSCYQCMFSGCTGIELNTEGLGMPWSIPTNAVEATNWNAGMFSSTGGSFTGDPEIGTTYYYVSPPPPGYKPCITFSSANTFGVTPQQASWNGMLYYSADATNWSIFGTAGANAVNNGAGEYKLYLCGSGNSNITGSAVAPSWTINAAKGTVACSGNIEALLDYAKVTNGLHPVMADYCFANLFENCTALNSAPSLPATTLAKSCYCFMFAGCTGLAQAPALPSETLAASCYVYMFEDCTALTQAPSLPATTLTNSCYGFMFSGCTGLTRLPELPATTLAPFCYNNMFSGCTGLTRLPVLPATNLANNCYQYMFSGCTGIELNTEGPGLEWGIPDDAVEAPGLGIGMFNGTSGSFTGAPEVGAIYYLASGNPDAPLFPTDGTALVFDGATLSIKIVNAESGLWYTLYAVDDLRETDWTKIDSVRATGSEVVFTMDLDMMTAPRRFFKVAVSLTAP